VEIEAFATPPEPQVERYHALLRGETFEGTHARIVRLEQEIERLVERLAELEAELSRLKKEN
jgi:hypothetical protein